MVLETQSVENNAASETAAWGAALDAAACEHCGWSFLAPKGSLPERCPHCYQGKLSAIEGGLQELPYIRPPEMVVPFEVDAATLTGAIERFSRGIPFAPPDLKAQSLHSRLQRVWAPLWLVDAAIQATWDAEVGFDYKVVSHQDNFEENRGGWTSRQVQEGRVRWEPRLGRLERSYQNVVAPALEDDAALNRAVGKFQLKRAVLYQPEALQGTQVRLPNRTPQDAWSDAAAAFQSAAGEECTQAAGADHFRQFRWKPEYTNQNWTLLLRPLLTTYYVDDEGQVQPVLIHGQTGQLSGRRRASMRLAQRLTLILLAIALGLFLVSLGVSAAGVALPPLIAAGGFGLVIALLLGLGAIVPVAIVAWFNHQQAS